MRGDKPVIVAVDDEAAVLSAVARDLRRRYGADYRVLRAESGAGALGALRDLTLRGSAVALFVADQRMPEMNGVEFLRNAIALYPEAKRVLLTAYADTEAAIQAINEVRLDHYLMKPWHPPEEHLYPVLDDLLGDWRANYQPPFEGVRVVGHRWSADGHRIRDFLARNLIPYRWLDVEADADAVKLRAVAGGAEHPLPLVVLPDGTSVSAPTVVELAGRLGLHVRADQQSYDLIIVGAGPAGLAAAVYGASEGLRTLIIEREAPGGQAGMSSNIENYLGFPVGLSGGDLARRAVAQARRFGAEILSPLEAASVRTQDGYHIITLNDGTEVSTQAMLIATGVSYRMLDVEGADRLAGAGVFYGAAITEALAAKDHEVLVIGAGNSAGQAAVYLARFARRVTIVARGRSLADSMSQYLVDRIGETPNINVRVHTRVQVLHGERSLECVTLRDVETDETETVQARAAFVFIGAAPRTEWLGGAVAVDRGGFVLTGPDLAVNGSQARPRGWTALRAPFWLETSVPGIFAAGDVRHRSTKRIASAVGEGAMVVQFVHQHLRGPVLAPVTAPAPQTV